MNQQENLRERLLAKLDALNQNLIGAKNTNNTNEVIAIKAQIEIIEEMTNMENQMDRTQVYILREISVENLKVLYQKLYSWPEHLKAKTVDKIKVHQSIIRSLDQFLENGQMTLVTN